MVFLAMYVMVTSYILAILFFLAHFHLLGFDWGVAVRWRLLRIVRLSASVKIIFFVLHFVKMC